MLTYANCEEYKKFRARFCHTKQNKVLLSLKKKGC